MYLGSKLTREKVMMSFPVLKAAFTMPSVTLEEKGVPSMRQEKLASPPGAVVTGWRKENRQDIKRRDITRITNVFSQRCSPLPGPPTAIDERPPKIVESGYPASIPLMEIH